MTFDFDYFVRLVTQSSLKTLKMFLCFSCTKRVEPVEDGKDKTQETQLNGSTTKIKDDVDERKVS